MPFLPTRVTSELYQRAKYAVKSTPLWTLLRPRRIHVYGVGPPKSGTTSLARAFSPYRSAHEAHLEDTVQLAQAKLLEGMSPREVRRQLWKRDRRDRRERFECESNALLAYFVEELKELFPKAVFICTVRAPYPWLRSAIDQHINVSVDDHGILNARTLRPKLYNVRSQQEYPEEEVALAEAGVWNLDAYLKFWTDHYTRVLKAIPEKRLLLLRTDLFSESIQLIEQFLGLPTSSLSRHQSHVNRARKRNRVLQNLNPEYIKERTKAECNGLFRQICKRLHPSQKPEELLQNMQQPPNSQ